MKKELKGIDENTAVWCPTQEEWEKVLEISGTNKSLNVAWSIYKTESCLDFDDGGPFYGNRTYYETEEGRKIITASDFIRLNIEPEETREIEGYKFKEETPGHIKSAAGWIAWPSSGGKLVQLGRGILFEKKSGVHISLEAAGVMHWFEPVYKPKYEVGQWVTVKQGNHDEFKTFKVGIIDENSKQCKLSNFVYYDPESIRLATPEEIEKATIRPVWERFPTWDDIGIIDLSADTIDHLEKWDCQIRLKDSVSAHIKLFQVAKAWNEGKQGVWAVEYDTDLNMLVTVKLNRSALIKFATQELAFKSIQLHTDLWEKFWMI